MRLVHHISGRILSHYAVNGTASILARENRCVFLFYPCGKLSYELWCGFGGYDWLSMQQMASPKQPGRVGWCRPPAVLIGRLHRRNLPPIGFCTGWVQLWIGATECLWLCWSSCKNSKKLAPWKIPTYQTCPEAGYCILGRLCWHLSRFCIKISPTPSTRPGKMELFLWWWSICHMEGPWSAWWRSRKEVAGILKPILFVFQIWAVLL